MGIYEIKLYEDVLVTFKFEQKGLEGVQAEILSVNEKMIRLLPVDLQLTGEGVKKWLSNRVIPKNRAFVDQILKTLGLSSNNTQGIIDVCKGLSLNDSYWVVPEGFEGTFAEYNLFENKFSEILSLVAYTGEGHTGKAVLSTSPELTTNGMLPKAWRWIEGDGIYLYKGGTSGGVNTGYEPYSEFYACQVAEKMGLDAVQYGLENWKGILASTCKLFTDIDTSYVAVGRVRTSGGLNACIKLYDSLGNEFGNAIRSMLVLDAVIYNEDRHFGNFGLLRDNHSGEFIKPAPLFDHGLSLFSEGGPEDFSSAGNLAAYAETRTNPYWVSYTDICKEVMGREQKEQLRKLINFSFRRHPSVNLDENRLRVIEEQLNKRIVELLEIPTVYINSKKSVNKEEISI